MPTFWDDFDNLPSVIQGLAFALLAILVPLAIVILQEIYQKKKAPGAEYVNLDFHVALDHVFRIRRLLLCLVLVFLPMLFWHLSAGLLRWLLLAISVSGIAAILQLLLNTYRWVKGNAFPFRFKYLANLRNDEDLPVVWRSVWQVQNINVPNEIEFFKRFSTSVDRLLREFDRKAGLTAALLGDFASFLDNRSTSLLAASDEGLPKILEWHYTMWMEEHVRLIVGTTGAVWWPYFRITQSLELAIKKIEERAMRSRDFEVFQFFSHIRKHARIHENDHVGADAGKRYYVGRLLALFHHVFFETVADSPARYEIWETQFPKEWKITADKLETSRLSKITLKEYLSWAWPRIRDPEVEFDKKLDNVTMNVFPKVEPTAWAILLIFAHTSWSKSRVQSVIERPWNFGFSPRWTDYSGPPEKVREEARKAMQEQMVEAFKLARLLSPKSFSQANLESFIRELQGLQYEKQSREEHKKSDLLDLFQKMLEFLNRPDTASNAVSKT